uniref:VENN motif pre-toxin domain-containing protein n=1 Tax=Gibbsiella quercinecans TaxID=929813 RepID=UPI0024325499
LIGDSNADTLTAAQAGKTSVENNALGADAGTAFGFWFGKIPDCDTACKAEIAKETAEGNAVVSAGIANTAGVAALSGPAAAMWLLGAGANAGVQYADNGEVNPINAGIAGWVNVISMGNGLWGTVGWNAAGGALTNTINGDDPLTGAITTGAGAGLGYGVGNYIVKPVANAAGKWVTGGWNPKFDPNLLKYTEVKGQLGISKEMLPSKIPGGIGNIGSSVISEGSGSEAGNVLKKLGNGHEE